MKKTQLTLTNISCIRGQRPLLTDLSFNLSAGELMLIRGSNGTGKSSLLRIVCGLLSPAQGNILWQNTPISDCRQEFVRELVYIGHKSGVKENLSVWENLKLSAALSQVNLSMENWEKILAVFQLTSLKNNLCYQLSAGQLQRVALTRLLLMPKQLWILDEPFTALDKTAVETLQMLLFEQINQGGMALLTTHQTLDFSAFSSTQLKELYLG
jgi:heme exporter protein A